MKQINPRVVRFFEALSDETRLKILVAVSERRLTVTEIMEHVGGLTISGISHQLRLLSGLGIVLSERKGKNMYYRLSHDYCWCILRDAFSKIRRKSHCRKCCDIEKSGGLLWL